MIDDEGGFELFFQPNDRKTGKSRQVYPEAGRANKLQWQWAALFAKFQQNDAIACIIVGCPSY
ncbi:MAG: hypothetical protein NW224_07305 [Leptolyngbyaceae cyanobacterium bins.302]|nr:hypothetical protein [Leptolyngbyaceae cyanobacterium bins.302]